MAARIEIDQPKERIDLEKIAQEVYGVALSPAQRIRLSNPAESLYLENMSINGRLVDGKINYFIKDGEPHLKLVEKKTTLEIPEQIAGQRLTDEQKNQLLEGKVTLLQLKTGPLFLQVDRDINRVVVRSEKEMGVPSQIGGYVLSDSDKEKFANKEQLPPRVFQNPQTGNYFMATIQLTEDGKGMEFSNYKSLDRSVADAMINRFNKDDKAIEDITSMIIPPTSEQAPLIVSEKNIDKPLENNKGILIDSGVAPFENDPSNNPSYYVKINQAGTEKTIWDVDLQRGLEESKALPGDEIKIQHLGNRPITVKAPIKDDNGLTIDYKDIETHHNTWSIEKTNAIVKETSSIKTITEQKTELFEKHVQDRNFSAIKSMTDKGFTISEKHLSTLTERFGYKQEEKKQLQGSVNISVKSKSNELTR